MLVHMHSQNYKSISRMDTSPRVCYYGLKEELNGCRCHRFLNCSQEISAITAATSDNDDEFAKWQEEVRKVELEAEALKHGSKLNDVGGSDQLKDLEGDVDERPSTPPDGEEGFTDDDGTVYKWDRGLRAWVPQV
ncbi:uncharacterized protein LOC113314197 [Papaver somniferum]|uniref:uncharacterized protein LOC113314197 n=1 Tax=Papaver somniferum TaxID=3469 RepID=UPI000E6FFDA4|nr:uncharacterized protein LOC113314197 [Papaver somniferum]XP_026418756.1 uncharacterized protein LOC113314197 [Papaver somniferum]XP_026418757.1 uncharacterized protein LOC113314197 [Papaver somniferum]XP_026418758.1 uncharacterized protein LOC113314197 [Papaver somniferum]XP_026418759.1 uncharacterized protein LOC113314197 [Papaver somniferum]XP_026418761.1 uncharacterized protein LOC113314197 [Papaver somniferum]XP_026418762.1 uncharacterized protein LOC113314197 [Papaver somniferum]